MRAMKRDQSCSARRISRAVTGPDKRVAQVLGNDRIVFGNRDSATHDLGAALRVQRFAFGFRQVRPALLAGPLPGCTCRWRRAYA